MHDEWRTKFEGALLERDPIRRSLRIAEAFEAIIGRMEELEALGLASSSETRKLGDALGELKRLRDLSLDRPA